MDQHLHAPCPAIVVENLDQTFRVAERGEGLRESLKSFVRRRYRVVRAVDGISFSIQRGELVGFLGPNGAGKTTTLKGLAGLLTPTRGFVQVLGFRPSRRESQFLRQFSLVMGQKQQLWWDLPAIETLRLNQALYEITESHFRESVGELSTLLEIGDLLTVPVRKLSLGERMKCELLASLLHRPAVALLDEPTIGLDVVMQRRVREFIGEYNRRYGATIILTSHYLEDVRRLCERVIVINHGRVLFDGPLANLGGDATRSRLITIQLESPVARERLSTFGEVVSLESDRVVLKVPRADVSEAAARLLASLPVTDVAVSEVPLEDVVHDLFTASASPSPPEAAVASVTGDAA